MCECWDGVAMRGNEKLLSAAGLRVNVSLPMLSAHKERIAGKIRGMLFITQRCATRSQLGALVFVGELQTLPLQYGMPLRVNESDVFRRHGGQRR